MLLELNACLNRPSGQSEGEKKTCNGIIGLLRFGFSSISTPKSCSLGSPALRLRVRAEHDDLLSPAAA